MTQIYNKSMRERETERDRERERHRERERKRERESLFCNSAQVVKWTAWAQTSSMTRDTKQHRVNKTKTRTHLRFKQTCVAKWSRERIQDLEVALVQILFGELFSAAASYMCKWPDSYITVQNTLTLR